MNFSEIDKNWTLFLDRDGVINEKYENDYVKNWNEFNFIPGSLNAICILSKIFERIIIVTNQRGVGKGLMKEQDLITIHEKMEEKIRLNSGRINKIYYCTALSDNDEYRKPNIGMAKLAKFDFPEIDFEKSIIVGDSNSDMVFGDKLNMKKILISKDAQNFDFHMKFNSLDDFSRNFYI